MLECNLATRRKRNRIFLTQNDNMVGGAKTYLVPWNAAMWWMLRRLRLAIEMDCDRRVLRGGGDAVHYADLLIAVGHRRSARRLLAPALVEHRSLLGRRILAICPASLKYPLLRVLLAGMAAGALIAGAYMIPRPALVQATLQHVPADRPRAPEVPGRLIASRQVNRIASVPHKQPGRFGLAAAVSNKECFQLQTAPNGGIKLSSDTSQKAGAKPDSAAAGGQGKTGMKAVQVKPLEAKGKGEKKD